MKFKTIGAALLHHLLNGRKTSTLTAAKQLAIVYVPREIRRGVEDKFGITVRREEKTYEKFGHKISYIEYSLKKSEYPKETINKMYDYVSQNIILPPEHTGSGFVQKEIF